MWEVQECDVMSLRYEEGNQTLHPSLHVSSDRNVQEPHLLSTEMKKKKGKYGSRRGNIIPKYVHVLETVFSLSEKPYCSFLGHLADVLDLSWSKS
ncbi:putative WD repeat-containing protein 44-like [Sesbania bispinosa]|nr:putative WD repeat-containing protein 44-like [Sesbania bispinosa]